MINETTTDRDRIKAASEQSDESAHLAELGLRASVPSPGTDRPVGGDEHQVCKRPVAGRVAKLGGLHRRIDRGTGALGPRSPQYVSMRWSM